MKMSLENKFKSQDLDDPQYSSPYKLKQHYSSLESNELQMNSEHLNQNYVQNEMCDLHNE